MEVYIKSFNRTYYLDRCLRSIKAFVSGVTRIVILDDGTPLRYLDKIRKLHPDIKIVQSPHGAKKNDLVADGTYRETMTEAELDALGLISPARFWCSEIARSHAQYICVLEEDVWFTSMLSLDLVEQNLLQNRALMFRFFWNLIPRLAAKNDVVRRDQLSDGSIIEYYKPSIIHPSDWGKIFSVAMAIFKRDYWLNAYSSPNYAFSVKSQIEQSMAYINRLTSPMTFTQSVAQLVTHGYSSTSRKTGFTGSVFDPYRFNLTLNEHWLSGKLDASENMPDDFSEEYLIDVLTVRLSKVEALRWLDWKKKFLAYYRNMGALI